MNALDDQVDHKIIDVRVTITPKRPLTRVWAKSFDVADPIGAAVSPLTGNQDNRRTFGVGFRDGTMRTMAGALQNADGCVNDLTDGNGQVVFRLDVSVLIQPGNNFRIVAGPTCVGVSENLFVQHPDATARVYNGTRQNPGDPLPIDKTIPANRKQSPLLVIWRRWHFEVDTMGGPGISVNIAQATISGFNATRFRVDLDPNSIVNGTTPGPSLLDTTGNAGRFQGGTVFNVNRDEQLSVFSNTATRVFTTTAVPAAWAVGDRVLLFDDDNLNAIARPDTTLLQTSDSIDENRLAVCYIRPIYDGGGNANNNSDQVPFRMNHTTTGNLDTFFGELLPDWNSFLSNRHDFWTGYLLGAFQPSRIEDGDSDDEHRRSALALTTGHIGPGTAIFGEVHRDLAVDLTRRDPLHPVDRATIERQTVVHEVGHQLNARHGDGGVLGNARGDPGTETRYSQESQRKMRDTAVPGSKP